MEERDRRRIIEKLMLAEFGIHSRLARMEGSPGFSRDERKLLYTALLEFALFEEMIRDIPGE